MSGLLQGKLGGFNSGLANGMNADGLSGLHTGLFNDGTLKTNVKAIWDLMDLINLQSDNKNRINSAGGVIPHWTEVNGVGWSQITSANRPAYTSGVPTFDGSNDTLIRQSEVKATNYSLYYVFKNTSALTKIVLGAGVANDYLIHNSSYQMNLAIGGVSKWLGESGIAVNKRYVVFSIHRTGNTIISMVDDRVLVNRTNTFAGEPTSIQKLCTNPAGNFPMGGGVKALMMSSKNLYGTPMNSMVIDYLRSTYNLSSDNAPMTVMGFGDSNTTGTNSTSYLVALSAALGLSYTQLGLSGTFFTNTLGLAGNGFDRGIKQLLTRPFTDYIVIQYGTNDVGNVAAATYGNQLGIMIRNLISAGHPPSKICLVSNPYQKFNANAALLDDFRTQIVNVATANNTEYWDFLQYMRDNGADAFLPVDNVHVNQAAQDAMSTNVHLQFTT